MRGSSLTRRRFLKAAGVSLALPMLETMRPALGSDRTPSLPRRRMVAICYPVGMHGPNFFPEQAGRDYAPSRYLKFVEGFRNDFTVFSGLSHPRNQRDHWPPTFLTGAPHEPNTRAYRNTISLDQLAAARIGTATRFPTLTLGGPYTLSVTQSGVQLPGYDKPSAAFAKLFLDGKGAQVQAQLRKLHDGRSIMDTVADQVHDLQRGLPARDNQRLDEYLSAVREVEQRLVEAEEWVKRPRPKVNVPPPRDVSPVSDPFGRLRLMYDLIHLALQTDSTRLVTMEAGLMGAQPVIDGTTLDVYHNLSHHGMDPGRIANLSLIEDEAIKAFGYLLAKLKGTQEDGETLLERTMVLLGSNLSNASSHDTTNLPILLAGGGFKHGQHLIFNRENNTPLCNLYVSMLQRLGLEVSSFGSSNGTLKGLELK